MPRTILQISNKPGNPAPAPRGIMGGGQAMFTIRDTKARFATFAQAADCAVVHARQRGEAQVENPRTGSLYADFRRHADGTVGVAAVGRAGTQMVNEWAGA